jgi:hypothetical protein
MVRCVYVRDPGEVTELVRGTAKSPTVTGKYCTQLPLLMHTGPSYVDRSLDQLIMPRHDASHWYSNQKKQYPSP